jgi:nucleotide-binding universal stress UspA family protein
MAYKDILVQIDRPESVARYAIAAQIAARGSGSVTGLFLKTTLINQYNNIGTVGYLPPEDLNDLIKQNSEAQDEAAARAFEALKAAAAAAKVECAWRTISGDTSDDLVAEARHADLVVLAPPAKDAPYNVHASAVNVALGSGGPVLIVPEGAKAGPIGQRALVAWNGAREAARALRDAVPLLAPGASIDVVAVGKPGEPDDALKAVAGHLQRDGFKAKAAVVAENGRSVAQALKEAAGQGGCDLIILGLYGHSRMREFVLSGVSREMLHDPSLPLLISH